MGKTRKKKNGGQEHQRRGEETWEKEQSEETREGEKEENATVNCSKEDVSILCRLRPLTFIVKEKTWRVVVILGVICGIILVAYLAVILWIGRVCLFVLVHVSPSSVVTDFCDDVSLESDWEFVAPQSSSFSKKALVGLGGFAGRDEI